LKQNQFVEIRRIDHVAPALFQRLFLRLYLQLNQKI